MNAPNKIKKFIKDSFTRFFEKEAVESFDKSSEWSNNNDTVVIKKIEYELLQADLFDQTQIIKKLKVKENVNRSLIEEYEASFIYLGANDQQKVILSKEKMENEIESLKTSESRLKSYFQALKRDLIKAEEESKAKEITYKETLDKLQRDTEELKNLLKQKESKIQTLLFTSEELKFSLKKRCEELVELNCICKELLTDFV